MAVTGRFHRRCRWAVAPALILVAGAALAEPIVYRGQFEYVVPEPMADKMTELAPREAWTFYPALTRRVDSDDDGSPDFVAIALGAEGGFGAQIRYRLSRAEDGGEAELGSWYWCVITDTGGDKIFEQFNP